MLRSSLQKSVGISTKQDSFLKETLKANLTNAILCVVFLEIRRRLDRFSAMLNDIILCSELKGWRNSYMAIARHISITKLSSIFDKEILEKPNHTTETER